MRDTNTHMFGGAGFQPKRVAHVCLEPYLRAKAVSATPFLVLSAVFPNGRFISGITTIPNGGDLRRNHVQLIYCVAWETAILQIRDFYQWYHHSSKLWSSSTSPRPTYLLHRLQTIYCAACETAILRLCEFRDHPDGQNTVQRCKLF